MRFERSDLELFKTASGDRNPLHGDEGYARRTPYGEPVVFGVLAALACLGTSRVESHRRCSSVVCHFRNPLFAATEYSVERTVDTDEAFAARIVDGRRALLDVEASFDRRTAAHRGSCSTVPMPRMARTQARRLDLQDLTNGQVVSGDYVPDWSKIRTLGERTGFDRVGIDLVDAGALALLSYLVGMELPGERALFSAVHLHLDPGRPHTADTFAFAMEAGKVDTRINRLTATVELTVGRARFGAAELIAFVRDDVPPIKTSELRARLPEQPGLAGKSAFVVGGSRGLGASIVHALSLSGCDSVFAYERSRDAAEHVVRTAPGPGEVTAERGDAADPRWCREVVEKIVARYGGLDFLVANACPSFGPLDVHPAAIDRILRHVSRSLELTAVPIATCLDALALRRGVVVVVSSSAITTTPAEWPHYVAGKCATEGFVEVAARQRREVAFLVVRPPKLVTDLMNTPLGRAGAMLPEPIAATIAARLAEDRRGEDPIALVDTFQ